jgi:hypothetical protein
MTLFVFFLHLLEVENATPIVLSRLPRCFSYAYVSCALVERRLRIGFAISLETLLLETLCGWIGNLLVSEDRLCRDGYITPVTIRTAMQEGTR